MNIQENGSTKSNHTTWRLSWELINMRIEFKTFEPTRSCGPHDDPELEIFIFCFQGFDFFWQVLEHVFVLLLLKENNNQT